MHTLLRNKRGLTLIELIATMAILGILASLVIPSARMASVRIKEIELRRNLREIRGALDAYKATYDKAVEEKKIIPSLNNPSGYPKTLEVLVDGYDFGGLVSYKKKFLRRIPADPFHQVHRGEAAWGMRSHEDEPDSHNWGGQNVFDVYSLSDATAIDKTNYRDW